MFCDNLKNARQSIGLSQKEFAEKIGIQQAQYSTYERGDRKPSCEILEKIVTVFNINVNYLLTGKGSIDINTDLLTHVMRIKIPQNVAILIQPDDGKEE